MTVTGSSFIGRYAIGNQTGHELAEDVLTPWAKRPAKPQPPVTEQPVLERSNGRTGYILHPHTAVERTILDGFAYMWRLDFVTVLQVGDGARHLENAIVGPGRQP